MLGGGQRQPLGAGPAPSGGGPGAQLGDAELVEAARAGDREAFTTLLRRHDPAMRRLAWRLLGDRHAMDDALQEAYVKAYTALGRFRSEARFSSWLHRIVHNACMDELRRGRRRPLAAVQPPDVASAAPGPERVITAAGTLQVALGRLPHDQRATVVLVDGEGYDHATAARILGVAPGTVASRLSRARAALRRSIEEVGR